MDNFDPRAAAANFPSSNHIFHSHPSIIYIFFYLLVFEMYIDNLTYHELLRHPSLFGWSYICVSCITLQYTCVSHPTWICCGIQGIIYSYRGHNMIRSFICGLISIVFYLKHQKEKLELEREQAKRVENDKVRC